MNGLFISFEGQDGAGKTTQIESLCSGLAPLRREIVFTREPGGTPLGEVMRRLLLNDLDELTPEAETLMFAAARAELVGRIIKPALDRGAIVICDRFIDSSLAYQGIARGMTIKSVMEANKLALRGIMPDITFFLQVDSAISENRLMLKAKQPDRMESEGAEFKDKVSEGFELLMRTNPQRIMRVDASKPADEIAALILKTVKTRLEQ